MTAKSLISTILYGLDAPHKPGRLISFGLDSDRPRSAEAINVQIIQFLQSVDEPCTLEEIAFETGQNVKVTSTAVEMLLQMELVKCTNPNSRLRRYELINYITSPGNNF